MKEIVCLACGKYCRGINGISKHVLQHSKECFDYYMKKYGKDRSEWPKDTGISKRKYKDPIICENCGRKCNSRRGISHHVLQHSKECFKEYVRKFGLDRTKWPKYTRLNIRICKECSKALRDPRSQKYCSFCYCKKYNPMKGEEHRQKMLNGLASYIASFNKSPSKPQVKLFKLVQCIYPEAILNFSVKEVNRVIDIAIPNKMIAIEYDGSYWHQNEEYDKERQKQLENLSWKFIRYRDYIPSKEKLLKDIKDLLHSDMRENK